MALNLSASGERRIVLACFREQARGKQGAAQEML
jgi:hypothetical protein